MTRETPRAGAAGTRLARRLRDGAERVIFASAAYRLSLVGRAPAGLRQSPPAGEGERGRGAALLKDEFLLAGERQSAADPWVAIGSEAWREALHGFSWLADLREEGSPAAQARARALIARWIDRFGEWTPLAWRADVLGRRLVAWLAEYPFFAAGSQEPFRNRFFRSLARQHRHLARLARLGGAALGPAGHGRLAALAALVHAAACLEGGGERLRRPLALLLRELARQILPDGGHVERSPAIQLAALRDLVALRGALLAGRHPVPQALQSAIDRMAPMLRFYRHGDGGLALFNGTAEGDAAAIDAVLALAGADGKPPAGAPHTGFQRLAAGPALVLVDTGLPAPPELDRAAHAGTLAFELSLGGERLVVNCGARPHATGEWLKAQRATAAHSTLTLADASSSELLPEGGLGRRPRHVLCRREEGEGATLVDASHDGYAPAFGALHRRRLYLAPDGEDLRGEDRLTRMRPGEALAFAIRFHLHPDVQASLVHDGTAALLRLPGGGGFRLDAAGGRLALAESVYLGAGAPRRSEQVAIESTLAGEEAVVKWSIRRVGAS
jgi:uncharacterized heparinase superfamily protein